MFGVFFCFIGNCVSIKQKYCMSLSNARFTCSEMDESKTVAVGIRRSRFLALLGVFYQNRK